MQRLGTISAVPLLAAAILAIAIFSPVVLADVAKSSVPKIKKDAPIGFTVHSLRLYAPLSLGAIATAAFGYDTKNFGAMALAPLMMAAAILDWKASQYRDLIKEDVMKMLDPERTRFLRLHVPDAIVRHLTAEQLVTMIKFGFVLNRD